MGTTAASITVDEFLKQPEVEQEFVELIEGEVISMARGGAAHECVKANLTEILVLWLGQHRIGKVFAETGYRLDDHDFLIPDLSVLSTDRLQRRLEDRFCGAPDLAIEVVSSETATRLLGKIRLYLKHGSKSVWAVFPEHRIVEIHSASGQITRLEHDRVLEDHDALADFRTPVSAVFDGL
jgi:Uma2 family endonuclease